MEQRDFEEINRFLVTVGKPTLFEYFGVGLDVAAEDGEAAIKQRRGWAQGQQSNPKFRAEALWVIKNVGLCRKALVDEKIAYLNEIEGKDRSRKLQVLRLFIMGTLADGVLTQKGEEAIREHGARLGLDADAIAAEIDTLVSEQQAQRGNVTEELPTGPSFVDHYSVLGIGPDADLSTVERAHRERYHWARQIQDSRRAADIYTRLDAAWEVLKNPTSRAQYDAQRRQVLGEAAPPLPIHPDAPPISAPRPEAPVRPRFGFASDESEDASDQPTTTATPHPRVTTPPPRPPENLAGRALPMPTGTQPTRPDKVARLAIDGPEMVRVKARKGPATHTLTIRNSGAGRMSGRVMVDRDWVEVSPTRLDAAATEQTIAVTVHPSRMPRNRAVAMVTVLTDENERKSVTIEAERPNPMVPAAIIALVLLAAIGVGLWRYAASRPQPAEVETATTGTLAILVDPPAGEIFIDGRLASSNGRVLSEPIPIDRPVVVKVELDGFSPWSQEVRGDPDKGVSLTPSLTLSDAMAWAPKPEQVRGDLNAETARAEVRNRNSQIDGCFRDKLGAVAPGTVASVDLNAYVSPRGYVIGLSFENPTYSNAAVDACIKRQLRSIKMPLVSGDYGQFKTTVRYTVPTP